MASYVPIATYRLQLTKEFGFVAAAAVVEVEVLVVVVATDQKGGQNGALRQNLAGQLVQLGVAEGLHVVPFLPCHARISRWSPDVPFPPQAEAR